jgi:Ca-activated chloride channel homolog
VTIRRQTCFWLLLSILLFCASSLNGQGEKSQTPLFKVSVDTVFAKVVVTDSLNRNVTGLGKEDFRIYEDKVQQTISHFSQQQAPVSLGIVFDVSGSMASDEKRNIGKGWFAQLVKGGKLNPEDEFFLITFNQSNKLVRPFTDEIADLEDDLAVQEIGGWTAMWDAVYRGIDKVREGRHEKKALILITDGRDNRSRYTYDEIREFTLESDVQIYAIVLNSTKHASLQSLAQLTGGRIVFGHGISYSLHLIHAELRNQYLLGYIPANDARDGKWRRISVKVDAPQGYPKLFLRTRQGYYAPKY